MGKEVLERLSDERLFLTAMVIFVFNLPFSEALKEISLVLSFLLILIRLAEDGFWRAERLLVLGLPVILFSTVSLFSALHSINRAQAMRGFWGDLETSMAWVVFSGAFLTLPDRMRTLRIILYALGAGVLVGGLVGAYRMVYMGVPDMRIMNLGDKNSTAQFLSMTFLIFLGVGSLLKEADLSGKLFIPVLVLSGGFLILCHSRSFLISLPIASLALLAVARQRRIIGVVAGTMVLAGSLLAFSPHLRWEMTTVIHPTQDGSFTSRYDTWKGVIRMFQDRPILGIGPDNFQMPNIHKIYKLPDYASHGHNIFFNILGEYGILGVLSFVGIVAVWWVRIFRIQGATPITRFLKGMTVGFLLNLFLAGMAHPMWGGSGSLIFMMIMALVLVMGDDIQTRRRPEANEGHSVPVFRQRHLH